MPKKSTTKHPSKSKRKQGQPTKYSQDNAKKICDLIIEGKSIRFICREINISLQTFFNWLDAHPSFFEQYARAKEVQAEIMADEILNVAGDDSGDYGFKDDVDGNGEGALPFFIKENVQRSRLKVDALKWVASKLKPKKYGDRTEIEHSGEVKGTITVEFVK